MGIHKFLAVWHMIGRYFSSRNGMRKQNHFFFCARTDVWKGFAWHRNIAHAWPPLWDWAQDVCLPGPAVSPCWRAVTSLTSSTAPWPAKQLAKAAEDMVLGGWAATPLGRQAASDLARQQAQQDSSPAVWEDWEPDSRAPLEPDSQHFARQPSGETRQPTWLTASGSLCRTDTVPDNIQVFLKSILPTTMDLSPELLSSACKRMLQIHLTML